MREIRLKEKEMHMEIFQRDCDRAYSFCKSKLLELQESEQNLEKRERVLQTKENEFQEKMNNEKIKKDRLFRDYNQKIEMLVSKEQKFDQEILLFEKEKQQHKNSVLNTNEELERLKKELETYKLRCSNLENENVKLQELIQQKTKENTLIETNHQNATKDNITNQRPKLEIEEKIIEKVEKITISQIENNQPLQVKPKIPFPTVPLPRKNEDFVSSPEAENLRRSNGKPKKKRYSIYKKITEKDKKKITAKDEKEEIIELYEKNENKKFELRSTRGKGYVLFDFETGNHSLTIENTRYILEINVE